MISSDLDTEAISVINEPMTSFFQSMLRSLGRQSSHRPTVTSIGRNRSQLNTNSGPLCHSDHGTQPEVYAASLSSLSLFIHDGSVSINEADDPYNAICFFYPPNYTRTEQWEFTGPIVGAVHFMSSVADSPPNIIHLANSSIAVLSFDEFTVALKASKVLCSKSLEACLHDIYDVFSLYFNNLQFVKKLCHDNDPDIALGRFKYNLAHIWTKLIGLVAPFKLLHPIAHIPHFTATEDTECQLYQFFACVIAILSGFSGSTFGCLLSYQNKLVQSTFDVNLTRTVVIASSLMRSMPQTAYVLPSSTRLPKSVFVRYAFAARSQLLESRRQFREQLSTLPASAQLFLNRFSAPLTETAFTPSPPRKRDGTAPNGPDLDISNNAVLSRYFDFAWAMAGRQGGFDQVGRDSLDRSFSIGPSQNLEGQTNQEKTDHWESRSSSMSSVAVNLTGYYGNSYAPLFQSESNGSRSRSVSVDAHYPGANFDQLWAERKTQTENSHDPFGKFSNLSHVLKSDDEESSDDSENADDIFSHHKGTPTSNIPGELAETVRNAASRLSTVEEAALVGDDSESVAVFNANGFLDSGHSSLQPQTVEDDYLNATDNSDSNGRRTGDSGEQVSTPIPTFDENVISEELTSDTVETVIYVQSHGPLSLLAMLPKSQSLIKTESLRRLYDVFLPILADVCALLMHLESETQATPAESVVVSFEPSRQRLHRLGLCRACTSDVRFDTQLFGIQKLFAKDPTIKDLQISDWSSHIRVTKENQPRPEETTNWNDSMAPYRHPSTAQNCRHSYVKVKRNGCASSLIVLPNNS